MPKINGTSKSQHPQNFFPGLCLIDFIMIKIEFKQQPEPNYMMMLAKTQKPPPCHGYPVFPAIKASSQSNTLSTSSPSEDGGNCFRPFPLWTSHQRQMLMLTNPIYRQMMLQRQHNPDNSHCQVMLQQ